MKLLLITLVFIINTALAQPGSSNVTTDNPCGVVGGYKVPYSKLGADNMPQSAPAPWGKGTLVSSRANKYGVTSWYYSPPPSGVGPWSVYWFAGTWETFGSIPWATEGVKLLAAPDASIAFMDALRRNMAGKPPTEDPTVTPVWCPWVKEIMAYPAPLVAPLPPVAGVWRTSAVPLTMYLANGTRLAGPIAGRKSPTNALCDCTVSVMSGTNTYCRIAGSAAAAEVALCRKVP